MTTIIEIQSNQEEELNGNHAADDDDDDYDNNEIDNNNQCTCSIAPADTQNLPPEVERTVVEVAIEHNHMLCVFH